MKKAFIFMALFAMVFSFGVAITFAGGQNTIQHNGDIGQGEVEQHQVRIQP